MMQEFPGLNKNFGMSVGSTFNSTVKLDFDFIDCTVISMNHDFQGVYTKTEI